MGIQRLFLIAQANDADERRTGLEGCAEARLALGQRGLGVLPFRNVGDERLYDLAPAPLNPGQGDLERHLFALRSATHPFETRTAIVHALLNVLAAQLRRAFTIRLEGR